MSTLYWLDDDRMLLICDRINVCRLKVNSGLQCDERVLQLARSTNSQELIDAVTKLMVCALLNYADSCHRLHVDWRLTTPRLTVYGLCFECILSSL